MNLIEESFQKKEEKKTKKTGHIILAIIIILILIIIAIVGYMFYIQSTQLKLTIDGQANDNLKDLLVFEEDGTIYAPIKEVASYFQYESYDGEYKNPLVETRSKCYVQGTNEVANFTLGSNKIYKLDISNNSSKYEYVYSKKPVKAINGVLYASTEAIEKAFNISFQYDKENNEITIITIPYLMGIYESKILDYGYTELNELFANQKAVLQSMLVVKSSSSTGKYGVIDVQGNIVLEPKYDDITYLSNTGDFLVKSDGRYGIMSSNKETKVKIMYNSIELMDSDSELYIVKNDDKYGVIDTRGNIKIYIENDEIGIDISKFTANDIKNKYILADSLIPVKRDDMWGLYDKNGKQVADFQYESLGYIVSSSRGNNYNLLEIPNYGVIVACKDGKYTLIDSNGKEVIKPIADDIYMTISEGETHYYINARNQTVDAEKYLEQNGIRARTDNEIPQTTEKSDSNNEISQTTENSDNNNEINQTTEKSGNDNETNQTTEKTGKDNEITQITE